jgi:hypothetical protein
MFCEDIEVMGMSCLYEWVYRIGRYTKGCVNGKAWKGKQVINANLTLSSLFYLHPQSLPVTTIYAISR